VPGAHLSLRRWSFQHRWSPQRWSHPAHHPSRRRKYRRPSSKFRMYRPIQPFAGITAPGIPPRGLAWSLHWMPMDFDTGLRTGACALSQHLRILYTAKVCTTLSVKLLSMTRVCAGSIRHGTRTVYKVLTLPVETEYKSALSRARL
jgi:hypothetical protein